MKTNLNETEQAVIIERKCPDCKCDSFYCGPEGGLSVNIQCANDECGARFNVDIRFFSGGNMIVAERIASGQH